MQISFQFRDFLFLENTFFIILYIFRCYRDEGSRPDRQPEFTQIDIEMSFTSSEEIMNLAEGLVKSVFKETIGKEFDEFPIITYEDAIKNYGSDKTD